MKTIHLALATHYATRWHTLAACLKITPVAGNVLGFTSHDAVLAIDGVDYQPGFDLQSIASSSSLSVDNTNLTIVGDGPVLNQGLLAGLLDNAAFELFEVNYQDLSVRNVLKSGSLGEMQFKVANWVAEFRSRAQALQQTQGIVTQKTCRARLGDDKCTLDLTPFTFTGTVDSSTDRRNWVDAARTEAVNYFAEGLMTITGATNTLLVGLVRKVKSNTAAGEFVLSLPFPFDLTAGDTYILIAGCMKRLEEDCRDKFDNVLNFQAEPHLPGLDALTKPGSAPAQPASTPTVPAEGDITNGSGGGGE